MHQVLHENVFLLPLVLREVPQVSQPQRLRHNCHHRVRNFIMKWQKKGCISELFLIHSPTRLKCGRAFVVVVLIEKDQSLGCLICLRFS